MTPQAAAAQGNVLTFPKVRFGLSREQEKTILERAEKLRQGLKKERDDYDPDYRELSQYFAPHLYRDDNKQKTRKSNWNKIINNTCRRAVRTMASGMQSGLTSPGRPWLKIGIEDHDLAEYSTVREWLQVSTSRMLTVFRRTQMYNTAHMVYTNMGIYGTGAQISWQDFEELILFKAMMMGRYWIGVNAKGKVDQCIIMRNMKVHQMADEYGIDALDPTTRNYYDRGDYYVELTVWVAIFPNPYAASTRSNLIIPGNQKPFVSCHWVTDQKTPLKTSGFDKFPVQAPRWETTDDEAWGFGPGHDAIGDTKAVQLKEREKAKGIQKMNNPPVSAPAEMRQGQFPISGLPGGVTYRPPNSQPDSVRAMYEVNLPLQYLMQDIQIDEQRINQAFYADLFLMLANSDRRQMTATEVAERHEEKLLALGPVVERLAYEFLDPMVERTFEVMMNHGLLPPPPDEIQGKQLKVEYVSLLAQAQQQVGIGAIEKFLSFTGFAAQFFPEAVDKVDYDQAIDEVGGMLGVPERVIVSDDKVAEKRQSRAEKQAQAEQVALGAQAVQAAQTLSQTPIGDGNALEQLTGA